MVWHVGDVGGNTSLWGMNGAGRWKEIWPSIPICHSGEGWISKENDLIFIGDNEGIPDRQILLVAQNAEHVADISSKVISSAVENHLLEEDLRPDIDFRFGGLEKVGGQIFVVLSPKGGKGLAGKNIKLPINTDFLPGK